MSASQGHPHGQRRAQTYDNYGSPFSASHQGSDGPDTGVSAARSQSLRDRAAGHLQAFPEPDPNDPPLPSYSALMASESAGLTHSPSPLETAHTPSSHARTPSLGQKPYGMADYGPSPSQHSSFQHGHDPYLPHSAANRMSAGSLNRRPVSNPNEFDFAQLNLNSVNSTPPGPPSRTHTMPSQQASGQQPYPPRHRSVTGGYGVDQDGAASVYSLDSGIGAYNHTGGQGGGGYHYQQQPAPGWDSQAGAYIAQVQPDFSNPYYAAAKEFAGPPPGSQPYASSSSHTLPSRMDSASTLARTNTTLTAASGFSSTSSVSLARQPTEVVGASSTRRRGHAIDLNKPPYTKQYVDDYRKRMKDDPDPEAQFSFAKYLIEAAKKIGDEISQNDSKLGRKYRDVLLTESIRNVKKLTDGKDPYPDAQFFLANLHGTGQLGLQVDHEKAYYLYLMASKLNHPASAYRSAVCNEIGAGTKKDPSRAILFYRKAAVLGDTAAMYKLGMILLGGLLGVKRDPREAILWLRRAASQADEDNPHALHELALLHERPNNGGVVPNDPNVARELFTQAAQLNYAPAQFKLGTAHEFGTLGIQIDPRRSIAWYTRAAERGDSEAELALSGWYLTGSEGVLKQSDTEAYLWGRRAANKGLSKAEYAVGYYTEIGIGVKQDMDLAKRWYQRAAAQQHKRAMQRLTELNNTKNLKGKKATARPTRDDAQTECVLM